MKEKFRDSLTVGFALFAIFFGAGNLIFPPYLGFIAGQHWLSATAGFTLTDPVLAIVTVIVTTKLGGRIDDIGRRVSPNFAKGLGVITILLIATLIAVPRTAATVHEIAIVPNFPNISPVWTSLIFFALTLYFVFNEGKVMNIIGNILTPILLITLTMFIVVVVFNPPGPLLTPTIPENYFMRGFTEGYQTMDALGAPLMAGIVVADFIRRGYQETTERYEMVKKAGLIALGLLIFIYGGLAYIGATMGSHFPESITRVEILLGAFSHVFGKIGALIIAIIVTLACLTTSVGLTATCGDFFHSISNGLVRYKVVVVISVGISMLISLFTVDEIIIYAGPILEVIYPVVIALVLLSLVDRFIYYDLIFLGGVLGAFLISLLEVLARIFEWTSITYSITQFIPLADRGFTWVIPSVMLAIIFGLLAKLTGLGKTIDDHNKENAVFR